MGRGIRIDVEGIRFLAELNDSPLAEAILQQLPTQVRMSRWGEEYYGSVGLDAENGPEAVEVVEVGDLAYWPPGDALCIFFGPTPASTGDEPRAASAVTVIGRIVSDNVKKLRTTSQSVLARLQAE